MYISKNPAKSRPLSANVLRMMRLSRASPEGKSVVCENRHFTAKDLACCSKQGELFMEAASMGFTMDNFAPTFMTSQLAGVFDASFSSSAFINNDSLEDFLQIPVLLKSPQLIVEALYEKKIAIYRFYTNEELGISRQSGSFREKLNELSKQPTMLGQISAILLHKFLDPGISEFTLCDVEEKSTFTIDQVKHAIRSLIGKDMIIPTKKHTAEKYRIYTFRDSSPYSEKQSYSSTVIELIDEMIASVSSAKDRRIGEALKNHLSDGILHKADYDEKKWAGDMCLAEQIGLVEKVDEETVRILPEIKPLPDSLLPRQKRALTAMYESFGDDAFTGDMFMATLDYSHSHACAVLHELTLIRVIDCWKEDVNQYRLTVNPEQNPEYFAEVA